jgi:hypothetical protein
MRGVRVTPLFQRMITLIILLATTRVSAQVYGTQEVDQKDTTSVPRILVASTVPALSLGAALYQNYVTFVKNGSDVPFHLYDSPYSLHADKFGHALFSDFSADIIRTSYVLAGLTPKRAAWIGASVSLLTEFIVEFEDGFKATEGPNGEEYFGFSFGDIAADLTGASLPLLKTYFPEVRRFDLKMSLWPSHAYRAGYYDNIFHDYESQVHWGSFEVHDLIGGGWPKWLNVAVGYGIENTSKPARAQNLPRSGQIYLALDLNPRGLGLEGTAWETVAQVLSHIRINSPALQVTPRVKMWWLR